MEFTMTHLDREGKDPVRGIRMKITDDDHIEVGAGSRGGPGYVYLTRSEALALADALREMAAMMRHE